MSNTPSDAELGKLAEECGIGWAAGLGGMDDFLRAFSSAVLAKWGAPQPVVREPLTTLTIAPVRRFLADRGIYLSDETTKELIVVAHGITQKGGQHGTER